MSERYIVTSRAAGVEVSLPEDARVVATLDRGQLVEADPAVALALEERGFRVKLLADQHLIHFFTYEIDTRRDEQPSTPPELDTESDSESDGGVNHIVQLAGPAQESWLAMLSERGVRLVEAVSPYAYFVRADAETIAALASLPFVDWTGPFKPAYKVNPVLLGAQAPVAGLGEIEATDIGVLTDGDVAGVEELVLTHGGVVRSVSPESSDAFRSITAELPTEAIAVVARHPDVRWVDAVRTAVLEDERSAQIVMEDLNATPAPNTGPNVGYAANLTALGADGAGVTIAICDTGVDTNVAGTMHADLAGRFGFAVDAAGAAVAGADTDGHGTHVAGIAAGNGASADVDPQGFLLGQGVAPGATVGLVRNDGSVQQRITTSAQQGAQVMNNSWAMSGTTYTANDRTVDLAVRDADPGAPDNTPLAIVFSAGNSGPGAGTVTKCPKNAILVGNSLNSRPGEGAGDDIRGLAGGSSRGPAADGRRLPTVTAPGTDIISTYSPAGWRSGPYTDTGGTLHSVHAPMGGTSMASPHVAGACAVLIDWWRQSRNGATPSPALIKALLVASAEVVAGGTNGNGGTIAAGPTNDAGYGRVSLENAFFQAPASDRGPKIFLDQRHAFTATGQEYRIRVAAADVTRPLRVALAWTDAPGAVGASPALVNDLDLEVQQVGGGLFRGNNFTGAWSVTGGTADSLNNTEVVVIQNPTGVYEISVVAANVGSSARTDIATPWQDFALVIDNAEVPAADPVSVVTVIDRSGSMMTFGYIDITRQTSRQFIDLLSVDDAVGVVSFGDSGVEEYPGSGIPQVITGPATRDAATDAVDAITFGGCTYMGAGIQTGGAMLAGAGTRRALVLLSDGYDNKGCDESNPAKPSALDAAAALPADLPIYSCAMGPASDQALLGQLAADTGGRYYFMPTIDDLFEVYNYIRGQVTGDGVIVNESSVASTSSVAGWVDGCAESVLFTVAWHDPALRFVSRDPKASDEISVRLRTPGGRWLSRSSAEFVRSAGHGYVSFTLQEPQAGRWTVEVSTNRRQHTPYTVGGFVRSPLQLKVSAPIFAGLGQKVAVHAVVGDAKGSLNGVKMGAQVTRPAPYADLLRRYAGALDDVKMPDVVDGRPDKRQLAMARLVLLRNQLLSDTGEDILASPALGMPMGPGGRIAAPGFGALGLEEAQRPVSALPSAALSSDGRPLAPRRSDPRSPMVLDPRLVVRPRMPGLAVGSLSDTSSPGSYLIAVTASGISPSCRSRFVRKDLVSVIVGKRREG